MKTPTCEEDYKAAFKLMNDDGESFTIPKLFLVYSPEFAVKVL